MAELRAEIHVRPGAPERSVGGSYGGALVVRVPEPAEGGRATAGALKALAEALGVPPSSLSLARGARSHRKLVVLRVPEPRRGQVARRLAELASGQ